MRAWLGTSTAYRLLADGTPLDNDGSVSSKHRSMRACDGWSTPVNVGAA